MTSRINHFLALVALPALLLAGCGGGHDDGGGNSCPTETEAKSSVHRASDPAAPFNVSGTISYEDRLYGDTGRTTAVAKIYGFIGTTPKPVRFARVQIVDETHEVLAATTTDALGNYLLKGQSAGGGNLRIRVLAKSGGTAPSVAVEDLCGDTIAASKSLGMSSGTATQDLTIPHTSAAGGAFNILDTVVAAGEFTAALTGKAVPEIKVHWQVGNQQGTYFMDSNHSAYIKGGNGPQSGDHDEFDDDVIWHEYGHFLEATAGKASSLGGTHYLGDTTQDLRLAWSEGWSNFLPGAIKSWLKTKGSNIPSGSGLPDSFYFDSYDEFDQIAVDFAAGTNRNYSSSEGSVARFLWELQGSLGLAPLWNAFANLRAMSAPANLERFWESWLGLRNPAPTELATLNGLLRNRLIHYEDDGANEPLEDTPASATLLATAQPVTRHLYAQGDFDYFAFQGTGASVSVETFDLRNGADTYVAIYDAANLTTPVATNDNHDGASYFDSAQSVTLNGINDGCRLASRVTWSAKSGTTYYIKVTTPPTGVPIAAGRYGDYSLLVSSGGTPKCPL